jgi:hypothetical protein
LLLAMIDKALYDIMLIWKTLRNAFLSTYYQSADLIEIVFFGKRSLIPLPDQEKPSILLVADKYLPRTEKIAFALHSLNKYNLILITSDRRKHKQNAYYVASYTVKSPFKTLWLVKKINPFIVHIFSSWNYDHAFFLIKHKNEFNAKIVFDDYDVFAGMLRKRHTELMFPGQTRKERYCLENTDGHCCRSIETQYTKRILKYRINNNRIFFPEYMWECPVKKPEKKTNVLVYVGNFNTGVITLAYELRKINWHLEIFSAHYAKTIAMHIPENLIVHDPVPAEILIEVLRSYPVAIQLPGCILDVTNSIYTENKYLYAASGKIFDYLEAGLPVLISDEFFQRWILKRYGAAIEIDEKNSLEDIIGKLSNFEPLLLKEEKAKYPHLTLKNQIKRLDEFYKKLNPVH